MYDFYTLVFPLTFAYSSFSFSLFILFSPEHIKACVLNKFTCGIMVNIFTVNTLQKNPVLLLILFRQFRTTLLTTQVPIVFCEKQKMPFSHITILGSPSRCGEKIRFFECNKYARTLLLNEKCYALSHKTIRDKFCKNENNPSDIFSWTKCMHSVTSNI